MRLIHGNCIDAMKVLIEEGLQVDLVVTSPPYNVDLGNNKYNKNPYNLYNDNKEHKEYLRWLEKIFRETYKLLKNGGRVCINIGDGKNGAIPTSSDIIHFMSTKLNYIPMSHIIWNKSQTGIRTAWGSFKSPSCPSFPTPFEHILIFAKENKKIQYKGNTDLTKQEFIDWSLSLWNFAPETNQRKIGHPAMFPVELPLRCIKMLSYVGAIILDPFMGAGTTGIACKKTGREFIGIELDEHYFEIAKNRTNPDAYMEKVYRVGLAI